MYLSFLCASCATLSGEKEETAANIAVTCSLTFSLADFVVFLVWGSPPDDRGYNLGTHGSSHLNGAASGLGQPAWAGPCVPTGSPPGQARASQPWPGRRAVAPPSRPFQACWPTRSHEWRALRRDRCRAAHLAVFVALVLLEPARRACAVQCAAKMPCACHAHADATHMPCRCRADSVQMPCRCGAHAIPTHQSSGLSIAVSCRSASGVSSPVLGSTSARPGMSSISTRTSLPSMVYRQKSCCGSMVGR